MMEPVYNHEVDEFLLTPPKEIISFNLKKKKY